MVIKIIVYIFVLFNLILYIMYRIKDISKVKLNPGELLIKLILKKRSIIVAHDDTKDFESIDYCTVIAVGPSVEDVEPGDYVMGFNNVSGMEWEGDTYGIIHRLSCTMVVSPDNFNFDKPKPEKSKIIS